MVVIKINCIIKRTNSHFRRLELKMPNTCMMSVCMTAPLLCLHSEGRDEEPPQQATYYTASRNELWGQLMLTSPCL